MINRTAQLILQTAYCTLAIVAILGGLGLFTGEYRWDFYIYFTNISNYLCAGVMLAELIQTIRKKTNEYVRMAPGLKFIAMLGIFLTFAVYNFLLAGEPARDPMEKFRVDSILLHIVLPILFTADWVLFYEHGKVSWRLPFLSMIFPLAYLGYVYLHAALLHFDATIIRYSGQGPLIYPYFFLDPGNVGLPGMLQWILILAVAFVASGFIFLGIDRLLSGKKPR